MSETSQNGSLTGIVWLFHQPWYVIVLALAGIAVAFWIEAQMKKQGWWPYKGDNMYVDQMVWVVGLLGLFALSLPVLLVIQWLGG
jgi:hypothetical protein